MNVLRELRVIELRGLDPGELWDSFAPLNVFFPSLDSR
jgi:hypothetical protein